MQIPASFDSAGMFLGYPVRSPVQEINKCRKSATQTILLANFRIFSLYFRVNSVDKSYRKAIINYLRKSKAKIGQNR